MTSPPRTRPSPVRPVLLTAEAAVVSVRHATIVPMTDADIARENVSRDAYAVAARRTQFDQLVWQVPVLSLTAQAFLYSIALSPDGTRTTRVIASLLPLVMTFLSLHLMVKHRQHLRWRELQHSGRRGRPTQLTRIKNGELVTGFYRDALNEVHGFTGQ
jgi:hypothetical protein